MVPVSSLAQQFYCEAKVEQQYARGEVPSEVKDVGTDLHEEILEMRPVKREVLIEHIERAHNLAASFPLSGEVGDLRIIGVPDAVIFEKSKPQWLIELKTTRGDYTRLWSDQLVQVRIYGLLLDKMGFDCSGLKLALVRMQQNGIPKEEHKKVMLTLIRLALIKGETKKLEQIYPLKFFVKPHDPSEAEGSVRWAQDYWLQKREPIPTKNQFKCKVCEYNDQCPYSLWRRNEPADFTHGPGRIAEG